MVPEDRKYTKTHEWVALDGKIATVGITDHAQDSLGDITFVEPPSRGTEVKQNKECGVIESVKAASDLYSPISGKVVETNSDLKTTPEIINSDPYGKGWIFKVEISDEKELLSLMDAKAYLSFLESEK
ncbi:MAG: glycine cleavage system protein GcvH [Chitinispirillaceae bacterium]|nr:glycine cleavage system protein GcvH [Chitinispirillaceae bacterium]